MDELAKLRRVVEKAGATVNETLLVLDATTGQNGIVQARSFTDAVDVSGVVLTKLDGSAKEASCSRCARSSACRCASSGPGRPGRPPAVPRGDVR